MELKEKLDDLYQVFGQLEDGTKERLLLAVKHLVTVQGLLRKDSFTEDVTLLAKTISPRESERQAPV